MSKRVNKKENYPVLKDLNIEKMNSSQVQENGTGGIIFTEESDANGYRIVKSDTLKALSADYSKIDESMTLKPGEVYEIFVTYEVDKDSYDNIQTIQK